MYANEGISVTLWKDVSNISKLCSLLVFFGFIKFAISFVNFLACSDDPKAPCITTGQNVLDIRSFDVSNFPYDFGGLVCLYCAFHFAAFLALSIKSRRK